MTLREPGLYLHRKLPTSRSGGDVSARPGCAQRMEKRSKLVILGLAIVVAAFLYLVFVFASRGLSDQGSTAPVRQGGPAAVGP